MNQGRYAQQLRNACADGNFHAVVHLLEIGADGFINDNYDGKTPLMVAAQNGNADIVALLVSKSNGEQRHSKLFLRDRDGFTAAHW
jgi:ankyrin repeat protein